MTRVAIRVKGKTGNHLIILFLMLLNLTAGLTFEVNLSYYFSNKVPRRFTFVLSRKTVCKISVLLYLI